MSEYRTFNQRLSDNDDEGKSYDWSKTCTDIDIRRENFDLIYDLTERHGLPFWLMYGTLLGAIREKDFINHDYDTDLGVNIKDRELVFDMFKTAIAEGFNFFRSTSRDTLVTLERKGGTIDFYFFTKHNNSWGCESAKIAHKYLDNLDTIDFRGHPCKVPSFVEEFLEKLYDNNWRTPIEGKRGNLCVI